MQVNGTRLFSKSFWAISVCPFITICATAKGRRKSIQYNAMEKGLIISKFQNTEIEKEIKDGDSVNITNEFLKTEFEPKECLINSRFVSEMVIPKEPNNLKVSPSVFRVEKSGRFDDNYENMGVIGKGGYGEVRKVRRILTNEIRAVKVISRLRYQKSASFSDEIQILRKIVYYELF